MLKICENNCFVESCITKMPTRSPDWLIGDPSFGGKGWCTFRSLCKRAKHHFSFFIGLLFGLAYTCSTPCLFGMPLLCFDSICLDTCAHHPIWWGRRQKHVLNSCLLSGSRYQKMKQHDFCWNSSLDLRAWHLQWRWKGDTCKMNLNLKEFIVLFPFLSSLVG